MPVKHSFSALPKPYVRHWLSGHFNIKFDKSPHTPKAKQENHNPSNPANQHSNSSCSSGACAPSCCAD